jgi:hypothetical protein
MKRLPIGIQSFKKIREEDYYYVDKTNFVKLLEKGGYYFLSRPRRFGKSLFLDTLKEAFSGKRELFKGLFLYDNWDWDKSYPVIKIDLSLALSDRPEKLEYSLNSFLEDIAKEHSLNLEKAYPSHRFEELIKKLVERYKEKVVVLIDEYDKPILDRIEDIDSARANREVLKKFFEVLKPSDPYLKLVFLTGVSRFSKVSIFSGLNQLNDITLDERFSSICGYTQEEFENVFEDRLEGIDLEEVKRWYNGYAWLGEPVYNPFDILLFLDKKAFRPYWFETGTPTFLIKLFQKHRYFLPGLENLEVGEELLSNLDIDFIFPENLLFQSGYLTIKESYQIAGKNYYVLSYPNFEVRVSFNDAFLTHLMSPAVKDRAELGIVRALEKGDLGKIEEILYSFFASIPAEWYRKNEIERYEGFYASVVYALFNGSGLQTITEDAGSTGRIDLTVIHRGKVYVMEFKVVEGEAEGKALKQIRERRYFEKYLGKYEGVYLVGIEFSKKGKNIVGFEWESLLNPM